MKRFLLVFTLFALIFSTSCEKKEAIQKESINSLPEKVVSASASLMESEIDTFHSKSNFESIRKKKLTNFGTIKYTPKVQTPDLESLNESFGVAEGHGHAATNGSFLPVRAGLLTQGDFTKLAFPFDFENDISAMKKLYTAHNLDSVLDKSMSILGVAKALNVYVHGYFKDLREPTEKEFHEITGPSAITIAKLKEQGIGGTSEHYAALLCQLGTACGFTSRIVSMHTISASGKMLSHTACELYISTFKKWVLFDPYSKATFYLRGTNPQNAFELRELMLSNLYRDITPVVSYGDFTDIVAVRENLLPRYKYIHQYRRNDIIGTNVSWQDLYETHLVWEDENSPVASGEFNRLSAFENGKVRFVTHNENDFNWPINQVKFDIERTGNKHFKIHFDTTTPNFSNFLISLNSETAEKARTITSNTYDLEALDFEMTVWSVNAFGGVGARATVMVTKL